MAEILVELPPLRLWLCLSGAPASLDRQTALALGPGLLAKATLAFGICRIVMV